MLPLSCPNASNKPIRSFVRREGRFTTGQRNAFDVVLPKYEFDTDAHRLGTSFCDPSRSHVLEIGFGDGQLLFELASRHPDIQFLGIEVYRPGVGKLLRQVEAQKLTNVRVSTHDAAELVNAVLRPGTFDEVLVMYPDPWPKKRHHKRRLIQRDFVDQLVRILRRSGLVRIVTDWSDYADHIKSTLDSSPNIKPVSGVTSMLFDADDRPTTKYERRGNRLGHRTHEFIYEKI